MVEKVKVTLEPGGRAFLVEQGTLLLDALLRAGIPMQTACGGQGACGKCHVGVQGSTTLPDEKERHHIKKADLSKGFRLACRLALCEDVTIDLPAHCESDSTQVNRDRNRTGKYSPPSGLAMAVDIGTTAIKMEVINLSEGATIAFNSTLNPQRAFGYDVMSRLRAARHQIHAQEMTTILRDSITRLILQSLHDLDASPRDVTRIVISGNTVMLHFFFGMDVRGLGKYPYAAQSLDACIGKAKQYGLSLFNQTEVLGLPAISAYLGGDLVAGILATNLYKRTQSTILIDIGTNSEIIFAGPNGLLATSCAAGPALEGMSIEHGITASAGAISGVALTDKIKLTVIGNSPKPFGLCGSGIIELMAELLRNGLVDTTGRMYPIHNSTPPAILKRLREHQDAPAFFLTEDVIFTQKDVRQVQLAKAAILSGQKILRDMAGMAPDDISSVIIAGEFGRHLTPKHISQLGMIEPLPNAHYSFVGNSSLHGAKLIALNPGLLGEAKKIATRVEAFPLATLNSYERLFIQALEFPDLSM